MEGVLLLLLFFFRVVKLLSTSSSFLFKWFSIQLDGLKGGNNIRDTCVLSPIFIEMVFPLASSSSRRKSCVSVFPPGFLSGGWRPVADDMKMNVRPILIPHDHFWSVWAGTHKTQKEEEVYSPSTFSSFLLSLYEKLFHSPTALETFLLSKFFLKKDLKWRPSSTTKKGERFMSCIIINKSPSPPLPPFSILLVGIYIHTSEMHPFSWISCLTAHTIKILARISVDSKWASAAGLITGLNDFNPPNRVVVVVVGSTLFGTPCYYYYYYYKSADMCIIIISPLGYTILLKTVHPSAKPRLSPGGMKNRFPFCGSRALGALSPYRRRCLSIRERLIGVGPETKGGGAAQSVLWSNLPHIHTTPPSSSCCCYSQKRSCCSRVLFDVVAGVSLFNHFKLCACCSLVVR